MGKKKKKENGGQTMERETERETERERERRGDGFCVVKLAEI